MMPRRNSLLAAGALGLILASASVWVRAQRNDARSLPTLLPSGAVFYLEAKDFNGLLGDWNSSEERRRWLKSENASVLSQSRLLQRLIQAQDRFAAVAGIPVEMNLVNELAGGQSALAFYDFSSLHFVYLTRLEGPRLDQSGLWKGRGAYRSGDAEGIPFYVKTETDGRSTYTVAFASHDGWLVVATEPALMARTLALIANRQAGSVANEAWFTDTVSQIPQQGDLRLVYNLNALRKTPQFRTYWIQRNVTEMAAFSSGSADVFEQPSGFEERRVLIRSAAAEPPAVDDSMAQVLSHIPQGASLYRAWANPSRATVRAVLQQVVYSDAAEGADATREAPQVTAGAAVVGTQADLETRIDEPAFHKSADNNAERLTDAVMAMRPLALLHSQTTRVTGDRVFVLPEGEAAFVCAKPDPAFPKEPLDILTTGVLDPLRISLENRALVLSRLGAHQSVPAPPPIRGETYTASYQHATEWPRYKRLFSVVDHSAGETPAFFSGNLRSLGDSLYRLRRESIVTQEEAALIRETVRYEFAAK